MDIGTFRLHLGSRACHDLTSDSCLCHVSTAFRSISLFVDACLAINNDGKSPLDYEEILPTLASSLNVTKILEAGRQSLDNGGALIKLPQ